MVATNSKTSKVSAADPLNFPALHRFVTQAYRMGTGFILPIESINPLVLKFCNLDTIFVEAYESQQADQRT